MSIKLPIELWQLIFDQLSLKHQLRLKQVNKLLSIKLDIIDLYHIKDSYRSKLTDEIIKKYTNLKYLDASYNSSITDNGVQYLKLHALNASHNNNITDNGIVSFRLPLRANTGAAKRNICIYQY